MGVVQEYKLQVCQPDWFPIDQVSWKKNFARPAFWLSMKKINENEDPSESIPYIA